MTKRIKSTSIAQTPKAPQEVRSLIASMKSPSVLAMMPDADRFLLCHKYGIETVGPVPTPEETSRAIDAWLAKIDAATQGGV